MARTRTCIIHIGMNKTASTSLQRSLSLLKSDTFLYTKFKKHPANQSIPLRTIWEFDGVEVPGYHAAFGRGLSDVKELHDTWTKTLEDSLNDPKGRNLILSAEALSGKHVNAAYVERIAQQLRPHFDIIKVIGYVRPPVSYMQSLFQQLVKSGKAELKPMRLYPQYRRRLEPWIEVFGKNSVALAKFDRSDLKGGDIVTDFSARIGIDSRDIASSRTNESYPAEAICVLYAYHRFGGHLYRGEDAPRVNDALLSELSRLGASKIVFAEGLIRPVLKRHAEDIKGISDLLGTDLDDSAGHRKGNVGTEQDIFAIAARQRDRLLSLVDEHGSEHVPVKSTITGAPSSQLSAVAVAVETLMMSLMRHASAPS